LILNLMPCVLPVLSIKLLSVVCHGGRDRRAVRIGFLASAAGILFSFLVLAGVAIGLKAGGMAVNEPAQARFVAEAQAIYEEFAGTVDGARALLDHALSLANN
jgi:suppressor for copper-sensitivity B